MLHGSRVDHAPMRARLPLYVEGTPGTLEALCGEDGSPTTVEVVGPEAAVQYILDSWLVPVVVSRLVDDKQETTLEWWPDPLPEDFDVQVFDDVALLVYDGNRPSKIVIDYSTWPRTVLIDGV